jgi:hypothetical protein
LYALRAAATCADTAVTAAAVVPNAVGVAAHWGRRASNHTI